MNTRFNTFACLSLLLVAAYTTLHAADTRTTPLPAPRTDKPFMTILKNRQSQREFSTRALSPQLLSDLLWAGFGINRSTNDHRTAPSAMNSQEIDIYLLTAGGISVYDAKANTLRQVGNDDVRARTGTQPFVKDAPIALVFVADLSRLTKAKPEDKERYASIDTGFISQNIYLFCASEGLATVIHELDRRALQEALQLKPDQRIVIAQSVGYPKEK